MTAVVTVGPGELRVLSLGHLALLPPSHMVSQWKHIFVDNVCISFDDSLAWRTVLEGNV